MASIPHSGHGSVSDIGASLGRDEDIEDGHSFRVQNLALRVDVQPIECQALDNVKSFLIVGARIGGRSTPAT
jgi:hypothetical protein